MGIFQFLKKEKHAVIVPEEEQGEIQEQVMAYVYSEGNLPKHDIDKWKQELPKEYRIRNVVLTSWEKSDGDIVKKGEKLFNIQIQEKLASTIYASVNAGFDGLLEILKKPADDLIVTTDTKNILTEGELVFRIYKEPFGDKLLELKNKRFVNIPVIKVDKFLGSKEIKWESVAGRNKSYLYHVIDDTLIFVDENQRYRLMFTIHNIGNKDFIVFRFATKEYKLTVGAKVSFIFSDDEIHHFEISNKPTLHCEDSSRGHIFETRVQLTYEELECLKTKRLSGWQIELNENDKKITGIIDSTDTQFSVNKLAKEYYELVLKEISDYQPLQNKQLTTCGATQNGEECYIYLMVDITNNYHKIGISHRPVIREKTLQSEKPTIEMVCYKRFPNRKIANSFELALHNTYKNKRVRGEWFHLSEKEIQELKETFE